MMLGWLTDRLVLKPSTHLIPVEDKIRHTIPFKSGLLEVWKQTYEPPGFKDRCLILKFPGMGGRAELATVHPAEAWPQCRTEVWTVNPPGYGGSSGRASVQHMVPMAEALYEEACQVVSHDRLFIIGNSMGNLPACYLASNYCVGGLILRNPPPLAEFIRENTPWWKGGWFAGLIADQIPDTLSCIQNASRCGAPALFIVSKNDTLVPPPFQQRIIDSYAGDHRILWVDQADHGDPIPERQWPQYLELLTWLYRVEKGDGYQ